VKVALSLVILAGAGLGLLLPPGERVGPVGAAPVAQMAVSAPAPAAPAAKPGTQWRAETRLTPGPGGHFHATALVNGQPVEFIVDTGATTIALTLEDARRIGLAVDPSTFTEVGMGAGGPVRGQEVTIDSVSVDGREVRTLRGVVLEGLQDSLLGQSYLTRIGEVRMSGGVMILR
jgi:aspartyl protease family protein